MIYEEYEAILSKIQRKEKELFDFINKMDELFSMTQPKSSQFDKEIVDGKNPVNTIEQYVVQKEYYQTKTEQLNIILDNLGQILKRKRDKLQASKNLYDQVYYLRVVEKITPERIAHIIPCDTSSVYKVMKSISIKFPERKRELYRKKSFIKRQER